MEGTRLQILQLLQRNSAHTVDGLAKAVGLAPATVRRHLDILQRDRLVAFEEVRKKTGRPEYSFYLTEDGHEALPKGYDNMLGMVVQELSTLNPDDTTSKDGRGILDLIFRRLSDKVADECEDELTDKGLSDRLSVLMRHLGQAEFLPEVDVSDGTLRINLFNCPFRSVALQNEAVCGFDLNLISSVLRLPAKREQWISDGDACCMYAAEVGNSGERELVSSATT
jgi:predicted ArsR family transcriptional regulator